MSDILKYYQTIPTLGIQGTMDTPKEFDAVGLPKNLNKKFVLDIGCNMGAFLFECVKRGAEIADGVEPDITWRLLAKGAAQELSMDRNVVIFQDLESIIYDKGFDLVLLLSITHLEEVENPQALVDKAWELTKKGGLLIIEINDRLQRKEVKLPKEAKLYGKNKDNRSVYHCIKSIA